MTAAEFRKEVQAIGDEYIAAMTAAHARFSERGDALVGAIDGTGDLTEEFAVAEMAALMARINAWAATANKG